MSLSVIIIILYSSCCFYFCQKIYMLLFYCYLSYYYHHYFQYQNHLFHLYNNSINFGIIGITISKSSALFINAQLIFDMHDLNWTLFLKISFLFLVLSSLSPSTIILPFTKIYASLQSHKSDLNIEVLNLILC